MVRRDKTAKLFIEMLSPGESEVIYIHFKVFAASHFKHVFKNARRLSLGALAADGSEFVRL